MSKKSLLIPMLFALFSLGWLAEAAAGSAPPPREPPPGVMPPSPPPAAGRVALDLARVESRIHELVNLERRRAGLPDLAWNRALQQIARNYSREMATRRFFSHFDPEGRSFVDRYRRAGFYCATRLSRRTASRGGENIAYNTLSRFITQRSGRTTLSWNTEEQLAAAVVRQWMTSISHRQNILTPYFHGEGIGVAIDRDGKVLITQNFC